jgi:DtxR family Mn-dependent transcriptional regulator
MDLTLSASAQDYLKRIYELTENGGSAGTNALAEKLAVKPASVTVMLQKLAGSDPVLVEYHKHRGVTLTEDGRKAALEIIRHHRLLETWLVQALGYTWDTVHEDAERLEHVISEDFERRIAANMGNPSRDPHGEFIPSADLSMPLDDTSPLSSLRPNQTVELHSVRGAEPELLRHLESLGLVPGARMEILEYSPFDQNLTIQTRGTSSTLGQDVTNKIYVHIV